jgi:hypothetical protein
VLAELYSFKTHTLSLNVYCRVVSYVGAEGYSFKQVTIRSFGCVLYALLSFFVAVESRAILWTRFLVAAVFVVIVVVVVFVIVVVVVVVVVVLVVAVVITDAAVIAAVVVVIFAVFVGAGCASFVCGRYELPAQLHTYTHTHAY